MLEIFFIVYILILFLFPGPAIAGLLGMWTTWILYRQVRLLQLQPPEGRKILWLNISRFFYNLVASIFLAFVMATLIRILIVENNAVFLLNLALCFGVSLRWFDFSHKFYQNSVWGLLPQKLPSGNDSIFVVVSGLGPGPGPGSGKIPVFTDAGFLIAMDSGIEFRGVFYEQFFDPAHIERIEKKSREGIRLYASCLSPPIPVESLDIDIRNQFYPFKCQGDRDLWFARLSNPPLPGRLE
ncbi:MAG: hypothetical protein COV67_13995 [Nitrospinae bacterium CG11_big_fil_rev_8_21_14_0_20_56_8]|nr:MAG: hypothetical protein COV67_13995 [Nitrospinae bacterium CG11_big_fil_rev_8_21_14_0_20_56_8]